MNRKRLLRLVFSLALLWAAALPGCLGQPLPPADANTFLVMADSRGALAGVNTYVFNRLLEEAATGPSRPARLFFGGDLSMTGGTAGYNAWKKVAAKYFPSDSIYPAFGNHDGTQAAFGEAFPQLPAGQVAGYGRTVYAVDTGEIRWLILNPRAHQLDQAQRDWLAAMLAAPRPAHAFVLLHEPFYPTGAHLGTSLDAFPAARDAAWSLLDAGGVEAVFVGHEHNYSRRAFASVSRPGAYLQQICAGSAGAPLSAAHASGQTVACFAAVYNYAVVRVEAARITITAYGLEHKVLDQVVLE